MAPRISRLMRFDGQAAGACLVAGVDEVGRGPLAGPVVAAAAILLGKTGLSGLNDSKQLSREEREKIFPVILRNAAVGIGICTEEEIDRINIYQASRLAMKRAVLALSQTPEMLLIDGKAKIDWPLTQKCVIEGDAKSASIAAASVVAKVHRDAWMVHLHSLFPQYEFHTHKGYGTRRHLEKIKAYGPSPVHRKSFAPFKMTEAAFEFAYEGAG